MYHVYILISQTHKKTYVGITENLKRRVKQHNLGLHAYTKRHRPWTLIYSEAQPNRPMARKGERYLKSAAGRRWIQETLFDKQK